MPFAYRSSAAALGGHFSRPFSEPLPVQASVALPPVGGHGSVRVDGFNYRDLISFRSATSTVTGSEDVEKGIYNTLASVVIEGLDIMGVITAERVVSRLVSERPAGPDNELPLNPVGSTFDKLEVAGVRIEPAPIEELFRRHTFGDIEDCCRQPSTFVNYEGKPFHSSGPPGKSADKANKGTAPIHSYEERHLVTSLFRPAKLASSSGLEVGPGGEIRVPGFGTIHIGEFHIGRYSRRLTMLRLEMGSPLQGSVSAGTGEGNGTWYPP
jgi:hypothetical protein